MDILINFKDRLRISTVRLALINSLLFVMGSLITIGIVYWQVTVFMEHRVDHIIDVYAADFNNIGVPQVLDRVEEYIKRDSRKIDLYGVFTGEGAKISGNLRYLPPEIGTDGQIREFKNISQAEKYFESDEPTFNLARAKVMKIDQNLRLVVGRDISEFAAIRQILLNGLILGSSIVLIFGLIIGLVLGIRPLARIAVIKEISQEIMLGNFSLRIPISKRLDELDMLAVTVNLMLTETEKLLLDIKGVSSTIAHDLRTPLTRVRFLLSNGLALNDIQNNNLAAENFEIFNKSIYETDQLLQRFTALLRIAEIENHMRKSGFKKVDPKIILEQIIEMFEPLAEARGVNLILNIVSHEEIFADSSLMLEAISNLVDNAIKFSNPPSTEHIEVFNSSSTVQIDLLSINDQTIIQVSDAGTGMTKELVEYLNSTHTKSNLHNSHDEIFSESIQLIKNKKELNQNSPTNSKLKSRSAQSFGKILGHGLGLGIVKAILRLHQFELVANSNAQGTQIKIYCK